MINIKDFCLNFRWLIGSMFVTIGMLVPFTISCNAQPPEDASLKTLRNITKDGRLPAESVVANIESRYNGRKIGVLARLLRSRIKLEKGDAYGAAQLLNSNVFAEKTNLGDYALWLKGKAYLKANNRDAAHKTFAELIQKYPTSMRAKEANLIWADSLLTSGKAKRATQVLKHLNEKNNVDSLLLTARAFEQMQDESQSIFYYRKVYFYGARTRASDEAGAKITSYGQNLIPRNADESLARANDLFKAKRFSDAAKAYDEYIRNFSQSVTNETKLNRLKSYARSRQMPSANAAFNSIPISANEKQEAFYELATGYAKARQWDAARRKMNDMRQRFSQSEWTPRTMVKLGDIAGDQRKRLDQKYYHQASLASYPEAVENVHAQFALAWNKHELKNYKVSSKMLTEHLARYVDKDTSYRGKTGYWAARDSEKAGKTNEACALYDATAYRYGANWYGYQALNRLAILRRQNKCQSTPKFPENSMIPKAVANLKIVTVAAETATSKELERAGKADELSSIGLFDWAIKELEEAKKTADNSPKINLSLAKYYRKRGENVRAFLALRKSYPDYSQMFPEEMGREEWDIFYPLLRWNDIKFWANKRRLDPYQVAGLIRQESVFNPQAASSARAYGLMQLLVPTARTMARKYSNTSSRSVTSYSLRSNPRLNIELGTAYMRENLDKYGRIEYMSVAYNAGPGRVVRWRNELPLQIDEFVEEIPFRETQGYVKGIIRNSAQYRRLYDLNGRFKQNVGSRALRGQINSKPAEEFAKDNPEVKLETERTLAE